MRMARYQKVHFGFSVGAMQSEKNEGLSIQQNNKKSNVSEKNLIVRRGSTYKLLQIINEVKKRFIQRVKKQ